MLRHLCDGPTMFVDIWTYWMTTHWPRIESDSVEAPPYSRLVVTLRTRGKVLKPTFLFFGSSIEIGNVDPRYDSLSRAYRIIVRKTDAQEP